ncbi:ATP-binding protein [Chelativorans sp. ZYF759]|uniref:hybrid sensor histidine kinase/response regulator n=1 Tax=Chelativorans sp. ZYF759 TaxID=2692213 RepID=UPI0034D74CAB
MRIPDPDTPSETRGHIGRARRTYNRWVANETLEDFALRYTARRARKWSMGRVANTAIGSISFLALEVIGAALTIAYGFDNAVLAILIVGAVLFLTGLPISIHAARTGVDIDLLTRGAGFGYIGSTVTSLIYASFTFIFFALEAAILSQALELWLGIPLWVGYLLNALIVIPLVTHGFARIGTFQKWSQPFWVVLHLTPFVALIWLGVDWQPWISHAGRMGGDTIDPVLVAAAAGVGFALMAQIGEQVDFLRFLPEPKTRREKLNWWVALLTAGPGWAVLGTLKMLAGSFLAVLLLQNGVPTSEAIEPTKMYLAVYEMIVAPEIALLLTVLFVILSQLKINVTNAYAGSIAWSNFFSRLTHSHPGRVVWLVFNVVIALMLMEFGVFGALESTLSFYGHVATAWIAAITADLVINRPLGLRPARMEFRRAHLCDINPVGTGGTLLASVCSLLIYMGLLGETVAAFSSFVALGIPFVACPLIAHATKGRYYLSGHPPIDAGNAHPAECGCHICDHAFDAEDMVSCPHHRASICSLCCALELRCDDACRPDATVQSQYARFASAILPPSLARFHSSRYAHFAAVFGTFMLLVGIILLLVYQQAIQAAPGDDRTLAQSLGFAFGLIAMVAGVVAWLQTLARESQQLASSERERQTRRLMAEIRAHRRTDAELQRAKERAEAANDAKRRYVAGMSHELRTPLNAILGYAQLLEHDPTLPSRRRPALQVIRRSSEHLADLIESLLDISKIEAGKLEIHRAECGLRDLIEQLVATFEMEARDRGITFHLSIDPRVPSVVYADARRLRQILMNLLSNAVRYTQAGHVRFAVAYRNEVATFVVEDTGVGIPAEAHARIFEPFVRLQEGSRAVPGTGLGLTISKLLVEILGGDLAFDSEPGQGSTFRVRLMLPRVDQATPVKVMRRIYGYKGRRRTIMIVDDNAEHRTLLEDALRPVGFDLVLAENGEAALSVVNAVSPDLVLIDIAMPGMSGWTLAGKLRHEHSLPAPIVMVSAHAAEQHAVLAQSQDVPGHHDDFLAKPVDIDMLFSRIERLLKLEWVLDAQPHQGGELASLIKADLSALANALAIGHVRGVDAALTQIEGDDPNVSIFVTEARRRLDRLDLAGIELLMENVRDDG